MATYLIGLRIEVYVDDQSDKVISCETFYNDRTFSQMVKLSSEFYELLDKLQKIK